MVVVCKIVMYGFLYSSYENLIMTWYQFEDKYMRTMIINSDNLIDSIQTASVDGEEESKGPVIENEDGISNKSRKSLGGRSVENPENIFTMRMRKRTGTVNPRISGIRVTVLTIGGILALVHFLGKE